jgi:hypothetical protein
MKKMAAFLLVVIGLGMVAMYLQPTKSMVNTTVYQERPSHSETTQIQEVEVKNQASNQFNARQPIGYFSTRTRIL